MAKPRGALRERRRQLGFTQETLAASMGVSATTYRDWERGVTTPRVGFRPRLAKRLQVSLMEVDCLLDEDRRVVVPGGVEVPGWLGAYAALEQGAAELWTFQSFAVPGLLQTPEYATAVERRSPMPVSEAAVAQKVQLRMARQKVLDRQPDPLRLSVVLDESVLLRIAGDGEIMFDQLTHLVRLGETSTIDVRVLPLDSGDFSAAFGSFTVLTSREAVQPYMACVLDAGGPHYLDRPAEVATHIRLFRYLTSMALSPDESVERIRTVGKERYQ